MGECGLGSERCRYNLDQCCSHYLYAQEAFDVDVFVCGCSLGAVRHTGQDCMGLKRMVFVVSRFSSPSSAIAFAIY